MSYKNPEELKKITEDYFSALKAAVRDKIKAESNLPAVVKEAEEKNFDLKLYFEILRFLANPQVKLIMFPTAVNKFNAAKIGIDKLLSEKPLNPEKLAKFYHASLKYYPSAQKK